jgi:hypothetical protein
MRIAKEIPLAKLVLELDRDLRGLETSDVYCPEKRKVDGAVRGHLVIARQDIFSEYADREYVPGPEGRVIRCRRGHLGHLNPAATACSGNDAEDENDDDWL